MSLLALAFVVSSLMFATSPLPSQDLPWQIAALMERTDPDGLATIYLRPQQPAMWLLLIGLWLSLILFVARRLWPSDTRPDLDLADLVLLISGLAAGAIWPWVAIGAPLAGFLLSVLMLMALIAAARRTFSDGRLARHPFLGILAGWTTVVTFAAFGSFLTDITPIPVEVTTLVVAVLTCAAAIAIQIRIPHNAAYTITVMFALLATAATTIETNPPIAVIAVLSMAALTFLLVRVTT
ncbi:MAG: hypothetical protein DI616_15520 [Paracoccus denitrificans]|uniref:Uncharacterized protein n=1 Tax=Paracoccus denitrificans TaxID=266 RepID=A0A533I2Q5_PARDE|nr:MAG: hypothetical protein DI616_15520 [Paracoccus denitrificans]